MQEKISIAAICHNMREQSLKRPLNDVSRRKELLLQIRNLVKKYEKRIEGALLSDLKKCSYESHVTEIGYVKKEIDYLVQNLDRWTKPKVVKTPPIYRPGKSYIVPGPLGLVLIIAPWNFPFQLLMAPLVGAIAAGNCAIIKPSELTPTVSIVINSIIQELDSPYIKVVTGGVPETTELLECHFDHIFFTGSTRVGKIVMEKAAKYLTPVTLELGGKSPCVVWGDVNLEVAARRIVWGRFMNAGQVCVAPDYILVQKELKNDLIEQLKKTIRQFYGKKPLKSKDFGKIISENQFNRLSGYLLQGEILFGGEEDRENHQISPTLIIPNPDSDLLKDEIFGPILPIIEVDSIDMIESIIANNPRPLAFYIFTNDQGISSSLIDRVPAGGVCVNDTIIQIASNDLPFGGVGESGMGSYHGEYSFKTFSHYKPVVKRSFRLDFSLRYPPYWGKESMIKKMMRWLG